MLYSMNHIGFIDLSHLSASWHKVWPSSYTDARELALPEIGPGEEISLDFSPRVLAEQAERCWLEIDFRLKNSGTGTAAGHVIAWTQLVLSDDHPQSSGALAGGWPELALRDAHRNRAPRKPHHDLASFLTTCNVRYGP